MKLAKGKEFRLDFTIGGKVDNSLSKSVNSINNKLDSFKGTIKAVATTAATAFASVKIKDWVDESVSASKEFETSMSGVAKVVDGLKDDNGKITSQYKEMKSAILELTTDKKIPMMASSIAEIMEAAGQSNIAKDELLGFSETASKMGIAFDSSADQAGEWMAAWRTALHLNQEEVTTLADKINYLGNTSSESAIKLSEVVTTVGSLSETTGISSDTVAAIAASMTKVESNVAATGIKNFALALSSGASATKRQAGAFEKLGLESRKISEAMQVDSKSTIIDVLERISRLDKATQASTMKDLFGKESLSSIAPLVANLDNLKEQFNKIGDASLYAGSMEREFIAASSTAANVDIIKDNKIEAMKIKVGDALVPLSVLSSETIGDIADSFGDFIEDNAPAIESTVRNVSNAFKEFTPTAVYSLKTLAHGGKELFDRVKPLGNWIVEHPSAMSNFIIATGTALTTYKISNHLKEIASSAKKAGGPLKYLSGIVTNPWGLAIAGVAGGIALLSISITNANRELMKTDLESRFGNISLSLKDIDGIASDIIKNEKFDKLSESLDIREGLDSISDSIDSSIADLSRLNWKVGVGLELTDQEQTLYKNSIINFLADTQELFDSSNYSLTLALEVLTKDDEQGKSIRDTFNNFYLENQIELKELGEKLNKVVNDAFSDGVLTIDEAKEISRLQQQMSSISRKLAKSEFEASIEVSQEKITGKGLTPESYKKLMKEMNQKLKDTEAKYDESLTQSISSSKIMLDEGKIDQTRYNEIVEEFKKNYRKDIGELQLTVSGFGLDTVLDAYKEELDNVIPEFGEYFQESVQGRVLDANENGQWYTLEDSFKWDLNKFDGLSKTAKASLQNVLEEIKPSLEQMEQLRDSYIEAGEQVPEGLSQGINEINTLLTLTGDTEAMLKLVGTTIAASPESSKMLQDAYNTGNAINKNIMQGLDTNLYDIETKSRSVVKTAAKGINSELAKGTISNAIAALNKSLSPTYMHKPNLPLPNNVFNQKMPKLPGHADGGIFNEPHITWFSEDGPEAAIPLDGSRNAIELWQMAGQILGMFDNKESAATRENLLSGYNQLSADSNTGNVAADSNTAPIKVEYNINVESGADVPKVQQAITMSQQQFNHMMSIYEKDKFRTNMG